ncbi:MAG: tetratricopeptide repeat protein [Nevskia sp.]|nr:tetratricopeptide repeat protein [Nevskia sp.]
MNLFANRSGSRSAAALLIQATVGLCAGTFAAQVLAAPSATAGAAQAPTAAAPAAPISTNPNCVVEAKPAANAANMSDSVFYALQKVTELTGQKKYPEALSKLNDVANKGGDYDKAIVNFNIGILYTEVNDYPHAADAFAKALSYKALPQQQTEQLEYNLGQLYVSSNRYDEGIKVLQTYVNEACGTVTPEAHMFLASALAERKRYPEALAEVDTVLAKIAEPKESWLQFRLGIEYELKNYKESADTLMKLIAMAPSKAEYWKQLSGVLLQMDNNEEATAVLALAERQNLIEKPDDIKNLYNTYMMIGEPMKAANLINTAIANNKLPGDEKTLEMVSDAWINARESDKAEDSLKKLASISDRGEYYFKLGAMYGDQERWKESKDMIEHALEKGSLKRPGDAYFRIAVANYGTGDLKGAIAALQKASTYAESKQQANEWLRTLGTGAAEPPAASSSAEPPANKVAATKKS